MKFIQTPEIGGAGAKIKHLINIEYVSLVTLQSATKIYLRELTNNKKIELAASAGGFTQVDVDAINNAITRVAEKPWYDSVEPFKLQGTLTGVSLVS